MERSRASILLPLLSLLAVIAGGIFLSTHWRTAVLYPQAQGEATSSTAAAQSTSSNGVVFQPKPQNGENVKGIYLNEYIADSGSQEAVAARQHIDSLLDTTELNAVVIDIKEVNGPYLPSSLKNYIKELHDRNVWVIARICVFRDSSQLKTHPGWYIETKDDNGNLIPWKDSGGGYWLDPAGSAAQNYVINFAKQAINYGFDELQFDYVRFPSDGDVSDAIYPFYDSSQQEKYQVIGGFFSAASHSLRSYDPNIILSADLFGYVASYQNAYTIGQRTYDAAQDFDYISYMLYPSHFYSGFEASRDDKRGLPGVSLPYKSDDLSSVVSNNPYLVIARSLFSAEDYLEQIKSDAKIRPWLQDFDLAADTSRGIYYDATKVREEINAAEESGASGWLLWDPAGEYTEAALNKP